MEIGYNIKVLRIILILYNNLLVRVSN